MTKHRTHREARDDGTPETRRRLRADVIDLAASSLTDLQHKAAIELRDVLRERERADCGAAPMEEHIPSGRLLTPVEKMDHRLREIYYGRYIPWQGRHRKPLRGRWMALDEFLVVELWAHHNRSLRALDRLLGLRRGRTMLLVREAMDDWWR